MDKSLIGCVGLHRETTATPFALGYWLIPAHWGQGFATEMTFAALGEMEYNFGPQLIKAGVFTDNLGSIRVLEKLGFEAVNMTMELCLGRGKEVKHLNMERAANTRLAPQTYPR